MFWSLLIIPNEPGNDNSIYIYNPKPSRNYIGNHLHTWDDGSGMLATYHFPVKRFMICIIPLYIYIIIYIIIYIVYIYVNIFIVRCSYLLARHPAALRPALRLVHAWTWPSSRRCWWPTRDTDRAIYIYSSAEKIEVAMNYIYIWLYMIIIDISSIVSIGYTNYIYGNYI